MGRRYPGNTPRNVAKDAKYSIVRPTGEWEVRVILRLSTEERALVTTDAHPQLVEMVNGVKEDYQFHAGGAFYIDEFRHVLVPTDEGYMCPGYYERALVFRFEGREISPHAPAGLQPGDEWTGTRVGIPYTLAADGRDIRYEAETRPNVIVKRSLSKEVGPSAAARTAAAFARHKPGGGRIYVNEAREVFTPTQRGNDWGAIYLGSLGELDWFADPLRTVR